MRNFNEGLGGFIWALSSTLDELYASASGGGALIVKKISACDDGTPCSVTLHREFPSPQKQDEKQSQNRGSDVQLRGKSDAT